jgi:hypothetical protein
MSDICDDYTVFKIRENKNCVFISWKSFKKAAVLVLLYYFDRCQVKKQRFTFNMHLIRTRLNFLCTRCHNLIRYIFVSLVHNLVESSKF